MPRAKVNSIQSCSTGAARHSFCNRQPSSCSRPSRTASSAGWAGKQTRSERPTQGPAQTRASAATCPHQNAIPFPPMCASKSSSWSFECHLAINRDFTNGVDSRPPIGSAQHRARYYSLRNSLRPAKSPTGQTLPYCCPADGPVLQFVATPQKMRSQHVFPLRSTHENHAYPADSVSLLEVLAADNVYRDGIETVVHAVFYSRDSAGRKPFDPLQPVRVDVEVLAGTESADRREGDGGGRVASFFIGGQSRTSTPDT